MHLYFCTKSPHTHTNFKRYLDIKIHPYELYFGPEN